MSKPNVSTDFFADRRIRKGKTAKDRSTGAHAANRTNKEARASWQNEVTGGSRGGLVSQFPSGTCNGKRSRTLPKGK